MLPSFSETELVRAWCNKSITSQHIPSLLYYYAKHVKGVEVSNKLIDSIVSNMSLFVLDIDLAMHDLVNILGLNVVTVYSAPINNTRFVLYRKFYE